MVNDRPELLGLDESTLCRLLGGSGRAREVKAMIARGDDPFVELPAKARARLDKVVAKTTLEVRDEIHSDDGTTKLLVGLSDGRAIESVLIPSANRTTLCVSTQVGCVRGCVFCRTGKMGLERNLSTAEIVGQLHLATGISTRRGLSAPSNVVFMGMGEPLDNHEAVEAAFTEMIDHRSFAIAAKRVTVSTVGPSPKAILRTRGWPVSLAWSLHTARDEVRKRLIPTARHDVRALRDAFLEVLAPTKRHLFVEFTLVAGQNDSMEDADAIIELLAPFTPAPRVNLLPMNPNGTGFTASTRVGAFEARLVAAGIFTTIRRARGQGTNAACGQLATVSGGETVRAS